MRNRTAVLSASYVLFAIFFLKTSAYPQSGFEEFKKSLDDSGKQDQVFGKFKEELDREYGVWLKDEREWMKITLEGEPPEQKQAPKMNTKKEMPRSGGMKGAHTRPDRVPLPEKTFTVTSGFGYRVHPIYKRRVFHAGIDYGAGRGTKIVASADGKILKAGLAGGYGNYVLIKHADQYKTAYAHLEKIAVKKDQNVSRGQLIGFVGSSGRSTGPHLHYEVVLRNKKIDPAILFKQ